MEIKSTDNLLADAAKCIREFLLKHGGLANGYNTFAEGSVKSNTLGALNLSVNNDDLSRNQLNKLGWELEAEVKTIMQKYKFEGHLKIHSNHLEYGCFETWVSVSRKNRVI